VTVATGGARRPRKHAPHHAPGELAARLAAETRRRLDQAAPLLRVAGHGTPALRLRFDLTGRSAGQVVWRRGDPPCIRYNLELAAGDPEAFLAETVAHEVAHLVAYWCHGRVAPHGAEWRAVMRHFGFGEAQRCHRFAVDAAKVRRQRRWRYRCACRDHSLSTTRHNRVQAGRQSYVCRDCGAPLRHAP
jgi:SprT protein